MHRHPLVFYFGAALMQRRLLICRCEGAELSMYQVVFPARSSSLRPVKIVVQHRPIWPTHFKQGTAGAQRLRQRLLGFYERAY